MNNTYTIARADEIGHDGSRWAVVLVRVRSDRYIVVEWHSTRERAEAAFARNYKPSMFVVTGN